MKRILIGLLFINVTASAQTNEHKPAGGGGYQPQPARCVEPAQRQAIQRMLDSNRALLRRQGRLNDTVATPAPGTGNKKTGQLMDWPLHQVVGNYSYCYGISNYVDHDTAYPNSTLDWNCGTRTYDQASGYNHAGTDIFLWPFLWNMMEGEQVEIIAAAPGIIIGKDDGNPDHDCTNPATTPWNAVYVQHYDGTIAWYGHMKTGTTTMKNIGDTVLTGEHLGFVGSSGNSTGPHLHFELHTATGDIMDPFSGNCNTSASLWNNQKPYYESAINVLMTHDAPPGFADCPTADTINARDTFLPGATVYFAGYYHDQLAGQVTTYSILRPDGTTYDIWTGSSTAAHYAASYWYWSSTIPATEAPGAWLFKASFQGVTNTHPFYILSPTAIATTAAVPSLAMQVTPVLAGNTLQVAYTGNGNSGVSISLINLLGQVVQSANVVSGVAGPVTLSIAPLPAGTYIARLVAGNRQVTQTFVKQ